MKISSWPLILNFEIKLNSDTDRLLKFSESNRSIGEIRKGKIAITKNESDGLTHRSFAGLGENGFENMGQGAKKQKIAWCRAFYNLIDKFN